MVIQLVASSAGRAEEMSSNEEVKRSCCLHRSGSWGAVARGHLVVLRRISATLTSSLESWVQTAWC